MKSNHNTEEIISQLAAIVGATHVSSAPADVKSYGGLEPFMVVWPGAPPEAARVLNTCREHRVAVGTAGFGTRAKRHWPVPDGALRVALDTRRMTNILDVDEVALTVNSQCGIQVLHLEEALNHQNLSLGPLPVEIQASSLGGLLAAPSPRAHSPQTGWLKDACLGLSVARPDGSLVHTRVAPRKATGPDISRFFLGSRGGLGVITTATLRVHRVPERSLGLAFSMPDMGSGVLVAKTALLQGCRPARLRLLDQTRIPEELSGAGLQTPAALVVVLAGPDALVVEERRQFCALVEELGGRELPTSLADRWRAQHRPSQVTTAPRPPRAGARLLHSELPEMLAAMAPLIVENSLQMWVEEFTLQGGSLWLSCREEDRTTACLRTQFLDAGMDPIRFNYPPLMDELGHRLDPEGTMVVMEGEWSGT